MAGGGKQERDAVHGILDDFIDVQKRDAWDITSGHLNESKLWNPKEAHRMPWQSATKPYLRLFNYKHDLQASISYFGENQSKGGHEKALSTRLGQDVFGPVHTMPDSFCYGFHKQSDMKFSPVNTMPDSLLSCLLSTELGPALHPPQAYMPILKTIAT